MHFSLRTGTMIAVSASVAFTAGCGGGGDDDAKNADGEIVMTCSSCPPNAPKDDAFKQFLVKLVDEFNAEYKGRYRIKREYYQSANDADSAQHYLRAATTDTLPDLFSDQGSVLRAVSKTGKLVDFAPILEQDVEWKGTFQDDAFLTLSDPGGHIWGVPEQRDVVGIFFNKKAFAKAGVEQFPATWSEALEDCTRFKAAGIIPFAADGDWVTQLMWTDLIGTKPGGQEFLTSGIKEGNLADNSAVVEATEFLKRLHTSGCINKDAFTGDYNNAAAPFSDGQAAMIANGPWMVPDNEKAGIDQDYAVAPDDGLIVIPGSAGWASGAKDEDRQEAVKAFMKFLTSDEIMFQKALMTQSYWPTKPKLSSEQIEQLEPLSYRLIQEADNVAYTYPHTKSFTPQEFTRAWVSNLPAYIQGKMSTEDFLDSLSDTIERQ